MSRRARGPRGLGSIRQLSNGRWMWQASLGFDQDGKRIRHTRERATREEVLEARQQCLTELRSQPGPIHAPEAGTLADWLAEWLRQVSERPGGSPNTYANYERACRNHIIPALGSVRLVALTTPMVADLADGLTPATREIVLRTLSVAWSTAWSSQRVVDRDVVARVPKTVSTFGGERPSNMDEAEAALLATLSSAPAQRRETMRERDLRKVLKLIETHWLRIRWLLGLVYGVRQSEALGLIWDDLAISEDGQTATLIVRRARIRSLWVHGCHRLSPCGTSPGKCPKREWRSPIKATKTGHIREIHVGKAMLSVLLDYRAWQMLALAKLGTPPKVPWMFTDDQGVPISHSADQKAWQEILRAAGVSRHYTLHDQRHTAASEAIADPDTDLPTVMALIGWKKVSTAEGYMHAGDERLKSAYTRQEQRFF